MALTTGVVRSPKRVCGHGRCGLCWRALDLHGGHHGCDATQLTAVDLVGASATTFQTSVTAANTSTSASRVAARTVVTAGTTTTTTSTTANAGCGGVTRCLNHTHCAKCLEAINATAGFAHSLASFYNFESAAFREYTVAFFQTLQSTVSCSTSTTPPSILHPALEELDGVNSCIVEYRMITGNCILPEYACFADPDCRQCFSAVLAATAGDGTKAEAFRSSACAATNFALLVDLVDDCGGTSFPVCSFFKHRCTSFPECGACLATLNAGNGATAARQCPVSLGQSGLAVDDVVISCIGSSAVACDFWHQRCADNGDCEACISPMGNGDDARAVAADWSTPPCQRAAQNEFAANILVSIASAGCPGISACRRTVTPCAIQYGDACLACINGSAPPSQATLCSQLSQHYSLDSLCHPCPTSVHTINAIVFATAAVGGASAVACLAVTTTIVAHGRDRVSMRDRILIGLMLTNAVYSIANAIPLNALRTGVVDCGRLSMSFDAIRFGRAWWF